jgi:hypothetical protein
MLLYQPFHFELLCAKLGGVEKKGQKDGDKKTAQQK